MLNKPGDDDSKIPVALSIVTNIFNFATVAMAVNLVGNVTWLHATIGHWHHSLDTFINTVLIASWTPCSHISKILTKGSSVLWKFNKCQMKREHKIFIFLAFVVRHTLLTSYFVPVDSRGVPPEAVDKESDNV